MQDRSLNCRIYNLVSRVLGGVDEGRGNWTWLLSCGENRRAGCCTLLCPGGYSYKAGCMLAVLYRASISLSATFGLFKWERCAMKSV